MMIFANRQLSLLSHGKIVCRFQGPMEISAGWPTKGVSRNLAFMNMKTEVKQIETYRPFDPLALVQSYKEYFNLDIRTCLLSQFYDTCC